MQVIQQIFCQGFFEYNYRKTFIGLVNVLVPFNPVFHFLRNPSLFSLFFFILYHHFLENQLILRQKILQHFVRNYLSLQRFVYVTICLCDELSMQPFVRATNCPCDELSTTFCPQRSVRDVLSCNDLSATICLATFCPSAVTRFV